MKLTCIGKSMFLGGASLAVLAVALPQAASAQTSGGTAPASDAPAQIDEAQGQELVVVGVRQAEQSAINRKRTARTAQDSIVADDIGQFPDKNAAEAIARIAGVALDVDDAGGQGGFTIRGQSADLIRVEVDGMSTLPTGSLGDQGGRAVSISDISSDLIKSVDVIKGQTADMTPGGVGGTVKIEQRNGLDFKKPLYQLNVQGRQDTLNGKWSPRINGIITRKFFDGRVGVILNGTYEIQNTGTDFARVSDKQSGYLPYGDQDNSPEKSFTTPFDPVAAAVTTKAGCAALPTTGINSRLNCYAQWEDFVPTLPRYGRGVRRDERLSFQARVDWRATDNLTAFVSYNPNFRWFSSQDYNLSVASPSGTTDANGVLATNIANPVVNPNHFVTQYDMIVAPTAAVRRVTSLNWTTQVRDIQRKFEQQYSQAGIDWFVGNWKVQGRVQLSTAYGDRADRAFSFLAPLPSATFNLIPENGLWNIAVPNTVDLANPTSYNPVTAANTGLSSNNQIEYTPQADRNKEWNYQLDVDKAFDSLGPLQRIKAGVQYRNRSNNSWRQGGSILSPGVVQSNGQILDQLRVCNPAQVTGANAACSFGATPRVTTAGSTAQQDQIFTITQQQYASLISSTLQMIPGRNFFNGLPDRGDLINSWYAYDAAKFYDLLGDIVDISKYNLNCLYECIASDGKVYTRPSIQTAEKTFSAYAMVDGETKLFGMVLNGNAGVRFQKITVDAAPVINFANRQFTIVTTPTPNVTVANVLTGRSVAEISRTSEDWLPSANLALWPVADKLGLRYSIALQRARPSITELTGTASVTCGQVSAADRAALETFIRNNPGGIQDPDPSDDVDAGTGLLNSFVNRCDGRIGNPELKGYQAVTQNLSLEWYPNRDTQLSAAIYQIKVKSGRPESTTIGSYIVDGVEYEEVASYRDGQGGLRTRGYEIAGRTAFTFLPWFLKYTGGGFNYSYSKTNQESTAVDPFTKIALPPRGQSKYYYNINAWYDDGRLNARVAYQARAEYFDRMESAGINRIPTSAVDAYGVSGTTGSTAYYKVVSPIFKTASKTLDARAAYKITSNIQLFVEGKNLTDNSISRYTTDTYRKVNDEGTPYIFDTYYSGRTYYGGVIISF